MSFENYNYFFGTDTYGTNVQVGRRGDEFYWRSYQYNGYGMAWSKWDLLSGKELEGLPEIELCPEGKVRMKWGWNWLTGVENVRLRLPKTN